jgi:hypothetical protein
MADDNQERGKYAWLGWALGIFGAFALAAVTLAGQVNPAGAVVGFVVIAAFCWIAQHTHNR